MDCNLPRSSIHGLFQARVLEWVAISFSRGTSQPRNRTWVSHIVGRCFTIWTTRWILNHWHTREVPILFLTGKPEPSNIIKSAFIWLNVQWRLKIFILKEKCRKSILFFLNWGIVASLVVQTVKNLPAMQETWIQSLGWEDPLEKGMATHSSILTWTILWTEEPGMLQFMGSQRVRHDWVTNTLIFHSRFTMMC